MANEIQLTVQMTVANGNYRDTFQPGGINVNQTTLGGH